MENIKEIEKMRYLLKNARPSGFKLLFLIVMTAVIAYELTIASEWLFYLFLIGFPLMAFTTGYFLYQFFFGKFPKEIEIGDTTFDITYEDGKTEKIPYHSISSAWFAPNPTEDQAVVTLFLGKAKVKTLTIVGTETGKKIVEDINSKVPNK